MYLDDDAQTKLTSWLALSTIMAEFTHLTTAFIPATERTFMLKYKIPSDHWIIWIGRTTDFRNGKLHYYHSGHMLAEIPRDKAITSPLTANHRLQFSTHVIQSLVVHVCASTSRSALNEYRDILRPGLFCQIWPLTGRGIDWPATPVFGEGQLDYFVWKTRELYLPDHDLARQV